MPNEGLSSTEPTQNEQLQQQHAMKAPLGERALIAAVDTVAIDISTIHQYPYERVVDKVDHDAV